MIRACTVYISTPSIFHITEMTETNLFVIILARSDLCVGHFGLTELAVWLEEGLNASHTVSGKVLAWRKPAYAHDSGPNVVAPFIAHPK